MDDNASALPEDDLEGVMNGISARCDNISSDALVEDSFSEYVPELASTPDKGNKNKHQQRVGIRSSPRLRARGLSPIPSTSAAAPTTPPRPASPRSISNGRKRSAPIAPTSSQPVRLKCPKCPSTLANKKTLDTYLRGHLMKGVTSRAPGLQEFATEMDRLVKETLSEILQGRIIGDLSADVHQYSVKLKSKLDDSSENEDIIELCTLLSNSFFDILRHKKIWFPSSIRNAFYTGINALLSSKDFMTEIKSILLSLEECEVSLVNVFIGNFFLILSRRVLVFSLKHMRAVSTEFQERDVYTKRSKDNVNSPHFRQLVYHIGGNVVAGFLWKGEEYSKNSQAWTTYCEVLTSKFLIDETKMNQCSEEVRHFTEEKDRGGLKHINDEAFSFFLIIFDTIMSLEGKTGDLPPNIVDENILASDVILCLWDSLVGSDLDQDQSLDLLIQISEKCIKIVERGIVYRRLNKHLLKPVNSVAMRARLAS